MKEAKNKTESKAKVKTETKQKAISKNKSKKLLIIGAVIGAVVLIGGVATAVVLIRDNNGQEQVKETVALNDNLEFEINSEVKISALVSEENTVNVLDEDELIDTSSLGEQEVTIRYEVDGSEESTIVTIMIVDTKPPVIDYQKELSTTVGTEIDLLKDVKVSDNSKEEIKATVEGDYDFNTEGTYNLKYVATDKSGNKTEEAFTLTVNKKSTTTSSSSSSISSTATKPSASSNSTSGNATSTNTGNTMSEKCQKSQEEFQKLVGKVYTSIPSSNSDINWSSAKIYVTKEATESGGTRYTMHNERISGKSIGQSHLDDIKQLLGPLSEMRYTEAKPLIIYVPNSWFCNNL